MPSAFLSERSHGSQCIPITLSCVLFSMCLLPCVSVYVLTCASVVPCGLVSTPHLSHVTSCHCYFLYICRVLTCFPLYSLLCVIGRCIYTPGSSGSLLPTLSWWFLFFEVSCFATLFLPARFCSFDHFFVLYLFFLDLDSVCSLYLVGLPGFLFSRILVVSTSCSCCTPVSGVMHLGPLQSLRQINPHLWFS